MNSTIASRPLQSHRPCDFGLAFLVLAFAFLGLFGCNSQKTIEPGHSNVPGVSDSEILVGSSLALSGHAGYLGTQTLRGALAYISHINAQGGVHGRKIRLIAKDDGYDPPRCLVNTQNLLVQDQVFCLFSYVGTPTTVKILPLVQDAQTPLVGVFTGANALREPFNRYVINVRASYYQETDTAVTHMVNDLKLKKIAVFYQYDAYGFDGLTGMELALKKFNLAPVARGSYVRGTLDVEDGLTKIQESGADAVIMIGTYDPCAKFIKLAKANDFHPLFHLVSFVGADELARRLGPETKGGVVMSQVVPPPEPPAGSETNVAAGGYLEDLTRYFPEDTPNYVGFEGYINARVLVEGLRKAGPYLTREGFIDALESVQNFSLGQDLTVSFSPTDHQGLEKVFFTRLVSGRFSLFTDWNLIREELAVHQAAGTLSAGNPQ